MTDCVEAHHRELYRFARQLRAQADATPLIAKFGEEWACIYGAPRIVCDGLVNYMYAGCSTGEFLRAVLANDLMEVFARADKTNRAVMLQITTVVYNRIPSIIRGSYDIVDTWTTIHRTLLEEVQVQPPTPLGDQSSV